MTSERKPYNYSASYCLDEAIKMDALYKLLNSKEDSE
jgi:hypothetical protein